jgi:hypothetical protein
MFSHDWFHRGGLERLRDEALDRCARKKFPDETLDDGAPSNEFEEYRGALETRIILYMKDGLTYEMKAMVDVGSSGALAFECVPVDENYKVGSIVIMAPYDDIARVEVFAVHPDDKPDEILKIPGFRSAAADTREVN